MTVTEAKEYFEKNKVVYGISAVNGRIENSYNTDVEKFRSWDAAMSWYKKRARRIPREMVCDKDRGTESRARL